mmetsp:Transcript_30496/g.61452  ORF Transcript_30496/g.61452 Transcript_30496/m.61452 type:complete len:203 (-) Transcript_30496:544-1152(-)
MVALYAFSKSLFKITYLFLRTACMPASRQMAAMSALEILSGRDTNVSRSTSSARFILAVQAWNTSRFCRRSGSGNSTLRSRRPGRSSAGSSVSCRFVAMITFTFTDWSNPSIWLRSSRRMRWTSRSAPCCASKRLVAMASISSMKMIAGFSSLAVWKRVLTSFSLSPSHFDVRSALETERKVASDSEATALARKLFPVPGGP